MSLTTLTDSQQQQLTVAYQDKLENPVPPDGVPTWTSSDDTVVTVAPGTLNADGSVAPDPTGVNAVAVATGKLGAATVTATDTRTSDGKAVTASRDFQVVAGDLATASIGSVAPVEKP